MPHQIPQIMRLRPELVVITIIAYIAVLAMATTSSAQSQPEPQTRPSNELTLAPKFAPNSVPFSPDAIAERLAEGQAHPAGVFPWSPVSVVDTVFKDLNHLTEPVGLSVGMTYTAVYQAATEGPGSRDALGGSLDLFGNWQLLGKKTDITHGSLFFEAEDRREVGTDIPPGSLGSQFGSLWRTTDGFNHENLTIRELYWQEHIDDDRLIVRIGKLDAKQYYGGNYWGSDEKYFMNQAFTGNFPAIAYPSKGLGFNITTKLSDLWYISAGAQDGEGEATSTGFHTLFNDYSLFSAAELGFTPTIEGWGKGTYRLTGWYRDRGKGAGTPHDAGISLSIDQHIGEHIIPFLRVGVAEGNITGVQDMISAGVGWQGKLITPLDVVGVAASWGRPTDHDLKDQFAAEFFYRLQVSRDTQLTVGYQGIFDPSHAKSDSPVGVFEVRWRIAM